MKLTLNSTYLILLVLILLTALTATFANPTYMVPVIMGLSLLKFWTVAFQFMELKNGNVFWKVLIIAFGAFVGLVVILLL
ncbi:cytochrome C oxidase subunit IV family protein [Flavobacterium antarcticum]|uniref:cytochrome C oxidase subunit IV family protein n=1 Tax=Flavobacterium antarcticum TaxID=271155 RepID=UPI0006872E0A|nr:cytochrome C oxidase subunit IV family protein [Flavobacterium antarcticum]